MNSGPPVLLKERSPHLSVAVNDDPSHSGVPTVLQLMTGRYTLTVNTYRFIVLFNYSGFKYKAEFSGLLPFKCNDGQLLTCSCHSRSLCPHMVYIIDQLSLNSMSYKNCKLVSLIELTIIKNFVFCSNLGKFNYVYWCIVNV